MEPENLAILLREPFDQMTDLLYERLAARGFDDFRVAHGAVFQFVDDSGTRIGVLADRAGVTKQAMAELVRHLESIGYVERTADPTDKRAQLIRTTAKGNDVFAVVRELINELEAYAKDQMGADSYQELRNLLEKLQGVLTGFSRP